MEATDYYQIVENNELYRTYYTVEKFVEVKRWFRKNKFEWIPFHSIKSDQSNSVYKDIVKFNSIDEAKDFIDRLVLPKKKIVKTINK